MIRTAFEDAAVIEKLAGIAGGQVRENAPLKEYTRFGIGGPASVLFDTGSEDAFAEALQMAKETGAPHLVIGGGTNLVVADDGYRGVVLRYAGSHIEPGGAVLEAGAGTVLQDVVDRSIELGLRGLETMTGIPGYLGGAIYGNAGAYGHSIEELVESVRMFDGRRVVGMTRAACEFAYRESVFKKRKDWVILSARLKFGTAATEELERVAREIRVLRDAKYPPTMRCAGSIFKNLLVANLPECVAAEIPAKVVREGKTPSAWFLEQVGVKGMRRGDIQIAEYHANLIYNDGDGTARDLVGLIQEVKARVRERFGFDLEEEVQYVGFKDSAGG